MKVLSWQSVVISWANALRLLDEPINDIWDLVKGPFFVKLISKIGNGEPSIYENLSEDHVYNVIENFLKDEYSGFRLLGYWDNDEVSLVSSVLLLWASLESQDFRTPLYGLQNSVQLKIQAFMERFVDTPQHLINRQLVMDAVLDIASDDETDDDSFNFTSSPRTYSSTPKRSTLTYSPGYLALSELRSLRSKVDLLNFEKQHLQEELDTSRSQIKKIENKLEHKEVELNRMINQMLHGKEDKEFEEETALGEFGRREVSESDSLKLEVKELRDNVNQLRSEHETALDENNILIKQLATLERERTNLEQKLIETESKNINLICTTEELESLVSSLKKTCEEQCVILAERSKTVKEDSFQYRESETLEGIVDIKYSEIQAELKHQTELLDEKSKEVIELYNEQVSAGKTIEGLNEEVRDLKHSLTSESEDCILLKQDIQTLKSELIEKNNKCLKLQKLLDEKNNELKLVGTNLECDQSRIVELNDTISSLKEQHNLRGEEMVFMKCELCDKSTSAEFLKDETDLLTSMLNDKKGELKLLEEDYDKMNLSKDKEISQLTGSIDNLKKEFKRLQSQLEGEHLKNEKLFQSAFQWRQKLSQGNTANEELARELIGLHECLEWKTLKINDLVLQMEQLQSEITDKDTIYKELQARLLLLTDKNKDNTRELQTNKTVVVHLNSKISTMEFSEKRLKQELVKKIRKMDLVETEFNELRKVLLEKLIKIDYEIDSCALTRDSNIQDMIEFLDFIKDKIKENKCTFERLGQVISQLQIENVDKNSELESYTKKIEELVLIKGSKAMDFWKKENNEFREKLRKIDNDFENNKLKLQYTLDKLESAHIDIRDKNEKIVDLQFQMDKLTKDMKEKEEAIESLQQNINLYEHEKSVLKKKLNNFSVESDKSESVKVENEMLKTSVIELEKQLEVERECLKFAEDQIKLEEKLNNAFDDRLAALQAKMKVQYEGELQRVGQDYSGKIDQLKTKVKKDCLHIEHLSSELWETSDRLLLAQQEAEALRNQLKQTRQKLNDQKLQSQGIQDSHSFQWLGGIDTGGYLDEMVTVTTKRTLQTSRLPDSFRGNRFGREHIAESTRLHQDDDEFFSEQCLEDLKAGICRLPPPERLSCPNATITHDDGDEASGTFRPPPEKPRKLKGSIMYRKPGPPTPSANAARHSLPGNDRLEVRKGLRENNGNSGQARSRLSQLFGSMTLSKATKPPIPESPKISKKKGFFQRTFGNRENLPPK